MLTVGKLSHRFSRSAWNGAVPIYPPAELFTEAGQGRTGNPTVPEPVEGTAGGFDASTRLSAGKLSHRFTRSAEMGRA